jgi:hypothetical protein
MKKPNEPKMWRGTVALGCGRLLRPEGTSLLFPFPLYLFTFCQNKAKSVPSAKFYALGTVISNSLYFSYRLGTM